MHTLSSRILALSLLLLSLGAATISLADPILHEFFIIPPEEQEQVDATASALDTNPSTIPEELSDALRNAELPPPLSIQNQGDEMELSPNGPPQTPSGDNVTQHNGPLGQDNLARPDRNTTLDHELSYFSVFNPSIVPWKRLSARDQISEDYAMGHRSKSMHQLKVEDRPVRQGYERFWGSVLVRMEKGAKVPIPSVSPQARILRYQTEPSAFLTFHQDHADNFYVSGNTDGMVRINYLMEAHYGYFGGDIDPKTKVQDLQKRMRPRLPATVKASADKVLQHIGLKREASFKDQLSTLVSYFRSFESRDFPEDQKSQNIYEDLAYSKLGVCRHRSFAFVVTAQAAGIMSRYVNNEAHAFVEVLVPKRGWLRVDLGGAAQDFNVHNSNDKLLHSPPVADTLPQPKGFEDTYSQSAGNGESTADINGDGTPEELLDGIPEHSSKASISPGDAPQGGADTPPHLAGDEAGDLPPQNPDQPLVFPEEIDNPNPPPSAATPARRQTRLQVLRVRSQAGKRRQRGSRVLRGLYRGDNFAVEGQLTTDQGLGLDNKKVVAYLVPKGEHRPDRFRRLGEGTTNPEGKLEIKAKIPSTLPLGPWSLYLYFGGTEGFSSSQSP